MTSLSKPLAGIKLLDLTRLLPGPMATRHLADLGAIVIKIQSPDALQADYAKTMGQPSDMTGTGDARASYFYQHCNAGKQELTLDLKLPADKAHFLELVRTADAVLESFRPGVMARLGLAFEVLQAVNPAISLISISGYGQQGAWAGAAGHDINYMALSGMLHEFCAANMESLPLPNIQYGDLLGGAMTAAFATTAAILHSKIHGVGCWMDVSMTASLLAHNVMPLFATQARGAPTPADMDLLNGGVPCYSAYRTADGRFLAVGALELKFWQSFCAVIAHPDWAVKHWSLGNLDIGNSDSMLLKAQVADLIASQSLADWVALFAGHDCCVTPVLRMDEALAHPVNTEYGSVAYREVMGSNQTLRNIPTVTQALKRI